MTIPTENLSPLSGTDMVVLVDPQDRELGLMEKMEAHQKGVLHRAFSFFHFQQQR